MENNLYKKISVELIESTSIEMGYKIWCETRGDAIGKDYFTDSFRVGDRKVSYKDYFNEVINQNLQYNNFSFFIFKFNGSPLFRELLYTLNRTAQWSPSQRIILEDKEEDYRYRFTISEEFKGIPEWEDAMRIYKEKALEDPNPDHNRQFMPFSVSLTYYCGITLKQLIGFLGLLRSEMKFFYQHYGLPIIKLFKDKFLVNLEEFIPEKVDPEMLKYFNDQDNFVESVKRIDDFYSINIIVSALITSHFIRQTDIFARGWFTRLKNYESSDVIVGSSPIKISYLAHKERVKKTVSFRTCWFSVCNGDKDDINSWYKFLHLFLSEVKTLDEFKGILPCTWSGNEMIHCPFKQDMELRTGSTAKQVSNCPILTKSLKDAYQRDLECNNPLSKFFIELTKSNLEFNPRSNE